MKMKILVMLLLSSMIGLASCSYGSAIEDTDWVLQSYGEFGNLKDVLADTEITAGFVSSEGTVEGSAGCNSYSGSYEVEDSQLSIPGPIAATEMYCMEPEGVMDQEQQYLETLQAAESYSIEDGELQINCGDQVLIYTTK
ncbi:hypothetical protein ES703_69634 [subsurface metagenome]